MQKKVVKSRSTALALNSLREIVRVSNNPCFAFTFFSVNRAAQDSWLSEIRNQSMSEQPSHHLHHLLQPHQQMSKWELLPCHLHLRHLWNKHFGFLEQQPCLGLRKSDANIFYRLCSIHLNPKYVDSHSHFQIFIFDKIHTFKISFLAKFTFSKSHLSQNSQLQNLIFHKIHNFKILFFTKFTLFKHQILGNFWIKRWGFAPLCTRCPNHFCVFHSGASNNKVERRPLTTSLWGGLFDQKETFLFLHFEERGTQRKSEVFQLAFLTFLKKRYHSTRWLTVSDAEFDSLASLMPFTHEKKRVEEEKKPFAL